MKLKDIKEFKASPNGWEMAREFLKEVGYFEDYMDTRKITSDLVPYANKLLKKMQNEQKK